MSATLATGMAGLHLVFQVDHIHKASAPKTTKDFFCPICKQHAFRLCLNG